MTMEKEYYINVNNQVKGPYSYAEVCSLGIPKTTFVSVPQDNSGWRMAKDIAELRWLPDTTDYYVSLSSLENAHFFLREGRDIMGPYSIDEFAILGIKEMDIVGIDNASKWYYAKNVGGLRELLADISQRTRQQLERQNQTASIPHQSHTAPQDDLYYVSLDGENFGPFDLAGLKGFGLFQSTLVRKLNEDFWRRAETLAELQGYLVSEEPSDENPVTPPEEPVTTPNPMMYDMTEETDEVYGKARKSILAKISLQKDLIQAAKANTSINYSEEMFEMTVLRYNRSCDDLVDVLQSIQHECEKLERKYNEDVQRLNNLYLHKTIVRPSLQQRPDLQEIASIDERKRLIDELYRRVKEDVLKEIRETISLFYRKNPTIFNERYEIAPTTERCWQQLNKESNEIQKRIYIGEQLHQFSFFGEKTEVKQRKYPLFLNGSNLVLHYDKEDRQRCLDIANTIIGRAMMALPSGGLQLSMIDANGMSGTSEEWKLLSRNVFRISARSTEVTKLLDETVLHIEHIIQNLLKGQANLAEYNSGKENQEPYRLLVIEDFPVGIPMDGINNLKKILKNGIRAGVSPLLLINEDEIKRSDDAMKAFRLLGLEQYEESVTFLFRPQGDGENKRTPQMQYDILTDQVLHRIVNSVNKGFEVKTETVLNLTDHLPDRREWWTGTSASMVEIPFGMSTTKNISHLRITQESGQNSAVVIGIPGSGKSVFLHSVIVDAAVKYSPDELQMYLLDFSGVEFNIYANHKLPHARVIAPEAEREFGLSVLRELKEEGARRMTLCRENDVTSIVQFRKKNPDAVMPRLLVIIDEFQKIFEIDNDAISKEANSIIHIIIQEYRKFGINLILATQQLPSTSVLPRNLIANRVVFKSQPNDFSALISWQGNMMPNLKTGQCIYNAESGAPYANEQAQGFFIPQHDIERIVDELSEKAQTQDFDNKDLIVFRGNDLPDFKERRLPQRYMMVEDLPDEVPVLLGQSIAISDTDVCAILRKESSNNLLVIGGEKDVAQNIILHASLSTTLFHTNDSARFYLFNFMRPTDPQHQLPPENFAPMPFPLTIIEKVSEVKGALTEIKTEIDARKQDENKALSHIYLSFFAFQLASVFERGGRTGTSASEEAQLLEYILKQGPTMGVFTLLQVDRLDVLMRINSSAEDYFTHRVVLQVPSERDSTKLMNNSTLANKLFVINNPSSKYRAYYFDQSRNVMTKFKPYR